MVAARRSLFVWQIRDSEAIVRLNALFKPFMNCHDSRV
ncbi:MAG: hypothetical protein C207_06362 [Bradyrhizobium sp. DFCI-1]|nr:MAG: hypothetical protein C207_06362 [Bradyrhizobium sp. DFCI-1]